MSLSRDEITRLRPDTLVTITITHALVNWADDNEINISVAEYGDTFNIPLTDDDGAPLRQVTVTRAPGTRVVPAGPDTAGEGRNLYGAVNAAIDLLGLPRYTAMGSGKGGYWLRLRDEDSRTVWAHALGLTDNRGRWGDGEIALLVSPVEDGTSMVLDDTDPLGLDPLGQDYEPDPAKRIQAIAAEFPSYVVRVEGGEAL